MRRRSVTFAALFACAVLGLSVLKGMRWGLQALGAGWWATLLIPTLLLGLAARNETKFIPDEAARRRWSVGLVVGSIVISLALSSLSRSDKADREGDGTRSEEQAPRLRGPSGK